MRIIVGRVSCRYQGRIDAELSPGDVVVLWRDSRTGSGDDSLLVMSRHSGLPPKNWMPAGSEIAAEEFTGRGRSRRRSRLVIEHTGRGERLEIFFHEVEEEIVAPAVLAPQLVKLGAEQEFADLLIRNLEVVEEGLEPIGREVRTEAGPIDILAREVKTKRPVVIETKRNPSGSGLADCYQLARYLDAVRKDREFGRLRPRGILVAPRFARPALQWLDEHPEITYMRLTYDRLLELIG